MSDKTQSIYEFVLSSINEDGKIPKTSEKLPDDASFFSGFSFGFVGGAFEGIIPSGKTTEKKELRKAAKISISINRFADQLSVTANTAMCKTLKERYSISYLQNAIEGVSVSSDKVPAFHKEIEELVVTSPDRNVVKYGLYLMTLGEVDVNKNIILNLAKHDEFTVHAIRAALLSEKDPNEMIFDIAKHVDGWGKISAVEYLSPDTEEIRDWLLRYGCANNIMDNYLALICADRGQLLEALRADEIDDSLFAGAGVILKALIEDTGPAESIDDYKDGVAVVGLYLSHAGKRDLNIDDLLTVCAINGMLNREEFLSDENIVNGWSIDLIEEYKIICEKYIADPKWTEVIWNNVKADDPVVNWKGREAAKKMHIDIWDYVFSRLQTVPDDDPNYEKCTYYFVLAETDDGERFQKLVEYTEQKLPLETIASGPALDMGMGLEYQNHSCLDTMLQFLRNKDGVGIKLIVAGLWSKVIRNRNLALSALETWDAQHFSPLIISRLRALKKYEPDKDVKKRVIALLDKLRD